MQLATGWIIEPEKPPGVRESQADTLTAADSMLHMGWSRRRTKTYFWPHHPKGLKKYLPGVEIPEFYGVLSSNWRGYVVSWAIVDGQFYFMGVDGQAKDARGRELTSNRELFPTIELPHKVSTITGWLELRRGITDRRVKGRTNRQLEVLGLKFDEGKVVRVTRKLQSDCSFRYFLLSDEPRDDYDALTFSSMQGRIGGIDTNLPSDRSWPGAGQ